MVRTYNFNASLQSEQRELQKVAFTKPNSPPPRQNYAYEEPSYSPPAPESYRHVQGVQHNELPRAAEKQRYFQAHSFDYSPFHSPFVDPVGSIIGLRLLHIDGKLAYVPVEPQISFLINQQFGFAGSRSTTTSQPSSTNSGPTHFDSFKESPSRDFVNNNDYYPRDAAPIQSPVDPYRQNARQSNNHGSGHQSNSQNYSHEYRPEQHDRHPKAAYGSMPNLARSQPLSSQEQHKLDLMKQIEDDKRRKAFEKQKELEQEQLEIRKWEEYRDKQRHEDELEQEKVREKARAIERRSQQVFQEQQEQARQTRRRPSPPPQRPPEDFYEKPPRDDSAQPRQLEWWEKKNTRDPRSQQHIDERKSAVIPALRGKPPAPSSAGSRSASRHSRATYDPSNSVQEHQSRSNSRASTPTEQSQPTTSGRPKKPTAFTIGA